MPSHPTFLSRASARAFAGLRKAIAIFVATAAGLAATPASALLFSKAAPAPVVQISHGTVSGKLLNGTHTYLGLPYAAPPVGALRWQPPVPADSWTGTRQATAGGSPCPQPKNVVADTALTEDCLYLNVHAPADAGNEKLPVIVWIHGGGFLTGSNNLYDLSHMARKARAVVVAINYRLGAFGFFRLPDDGTQLNRPPSNFGLMDQQAALRWVKDEIGHFGGDASRVTLMGQSSGGATACMHMVASGSAGLFHRAIIQSGICTPVGSPTTGSLESSAARLADGMGCPSGPGQLTCLRNRPTADVLAASATSGRIFDSGIVWGPVPDGITLAADPAQMVREGRFQRVPVLLGSNHDEGRFFVAIDYHLKSLLPVTTTQMNEAYDRAAEGDAAFSATLASTYTASVYGSRDKALGALITDVVASCKVMRFAEDLARHTPVYLYEFSEANTPGMIDPYMGMGAFHAVELRYLFQVKLAGPTINLPLSKPQQKLADTMVAYWGAMAAQGAPQASGAPAWPPFTASSTSLMSLASNGIKLLDAQAFRDDHHCAIWGDRGPR